MLFAIAFLFWFYHEFNGNNKLQIKYLKIFNYSRLTIGGREILYNK